MSFGNLPSAWLRKKTANERQISRWVKYDAFERLEGTTKVEIDTSIIDATNVNMSLGETGSYPGSRKTLLAKVIQVKNRKRAFDQVRDEDGTNGLLRLEQMLHRVDRIVADSELACELNSLIYKDFANFVTDEELAA